MAVSKVQHLRIEGISNVIIVGPLKRSEASWNDIQYGLIQN